MKKILIYATCFALLMTFSPVSLAANQSPNYHMAIRDDSGNQVVASFAIAGGEISSEQLDDIYAQAVHSALSVIPNAVACDESPNGQHNWKVTTKVAMFHVAQGDGTCKYWEQRVLECSYCGDVKLEGTKRNQKSHTTGSTKCDNTFPHL